MMKISKPLLILSLAFLILSITHIIISFRTVKIPSFEELKIQFCGGDNELLIYGDETNLCIGEKNFKYISDYNNNLNANNKLTNRLASGGYLVSFLITIISSIVKEK